MSPAVRRCVACLATLTVAAAVGCGPQRTDAGAEGRPSPLPRSAGGSAPDPAAPPTPGRPVPTVEYAELRWEFGPGTRRVTFERPGERVYGVYFGDVLAKLGLSRPAPAGTPTPTSTDLLTMLSADGWELVTHAARTDAADLRGGNARFASASPEAPTAAAAAPAPVHTEVWTLRRPAGF